jgi:hypothetical protein
MFTGVLPPVVAERRWYVCHGADLVHRLHPQRHRTVHQGPCGHLRDTHITLREVRITVAKSHVS